MLTQTLETRLRTLNAILPKSTRHQLLNDAVKTADGDWAAAFASLKGKLADTTIQKLAVAHSLADWSGDNVPIVKALPATGNVTSLLDVALMFNADRLAAIVDPP